MTEEAHPEHARGRATTPEGPPPLLGSWRNLYVLLAVELAVLVVLFRALGWWAS
jgi:hypothetical protein